MTWILTHSGRKFNFAELHPDAVDIHDIAHALSHIPRFTGHTRAFYSVAQHSIMVSDLVPPEHALVALLHDATEAYINDLAKPLKEMLPAYCRLERRVWVVIAEKFGLPIHLPRCVKKADLTALATEKRDLCTAHSEAWACLEGVPAVPERVYPLTPDLAKEAFLRRFTELALCDAA